MRTPRAQEDDDSSKSAFASVPMALLARKGAFSAEGKVTKQELSWFNVCSDLMHQETLWSCANSGACQTLSFALELVGCVCQRLREQWASIAQWASDDEKSVITTFLDASVLFAFRACTATATAADVFQDGFHLLSVLCCDEYKPFGPVTSLTLPAPLRNPQNPVNAFMSASTLSSLTGDSSNSASVPFTDSIEQLLAQSMGPCSQSPLSCSVPEVAPAQSFVSRCLETVAKHGIVARLLGQVAARTDSPFPTATLSFLASAKACLTPDCLPLLVNLVLVLTEHAQNYLCDALSCRVVESNNESAEQEPKLANLKSALQVLSLAEGPADQTNYRKMSEMAGWSMLSAVAHPLLPLGEECAPRSSVPLSMTVLQFVDAALEMLDHASVQPLFTGKSSNPHAVYKLVQSLAVCNRELRAKPSSPRCAVAAAATPAVTPDLHAPPAPPPPPQLGRRGLRSRHLCLRRRLEEADADTSNKNDDGDSLCGTMFDETPSRTPKAASKESAAAAATPVQVDSLVTLSDRVLCHALELLSRELVRAPPCLNEPELPQFLVAVSKLFQSNAEPASVQSAWNTLLQQLSACPLFPTDALAAFMTPRDRKSVV